MTKIQVRLQKLLKQKRAFLKEKRDIKCTAFISSRTLLPREERSISRIDVKVEKLTERIEKEEARIKEEGIIDFEKIISQQILSA